MNLKSSYIVLYDKEFGVLGKIKKLKLRDRFGYCICGGGNVRDVLDIV